MSYEGHVIVELTGASHNCEVISKVKYGCRGNPDLTQLYGDIRMWIDFDERARTFDLSKNYFTNYEDFTGCVEMLEDNEKITLRGRQPDGTYIKYDGINVVYTVGYKYHNGVKQLDHVGTRWLINKIKLVEAE